VRELRNVVERAVYRAEDPERPIDEVQFDPFHSPWAMGSVAPPSVPSTAVQRDASETLTPTTAPADAAAMPVATSDFRSAVASYERALLEDALRKSRFNQRATAAALGLSYDQLRHALKRHKLQDSAT
jgi:psp operon transcriptional activator